MNFMTQLRNLLPTDEERCYHQRTELLEGNCTYEGAHLRQGTIVLSTYRPHYLHCLDCDEMLYNTRRDAYGAEHPMGELICETEIPHFEVSDYIREHHHDVANGGFYQ